MKKYIRPFIDLSFLTNIVKGYVIYVSHNIDVIHCVLHFVTVVQCTPGNKFFQLICYNIKKAFF